MKDLMHMRVNSKVILVIYVTRCLVRTCRRLLLLAIVCCPDHATSRLARWRKIVDANDMQAVAEGAQP